MQNSNPTIQSEQQEEASLGDLVYKFLPYWPLFIILLIISLFAAWIYLRYTKPIYRTTATILIKDDQKNSGADQMMQAFDMFGSKKNVENEVEVLQSKTLMQDVVKNLHLYAPVYADGRVLNQSAYVISPIVIEARYPDSLRPVNKVPFIYRNDTGTIEIDSSKYPLNQWVSTSYGELRFLQNKYYRNEKMEEKTNFFFSINNVKNTANSILGEVSISPSNKQSTVIELSIEGEVPKRGEDILNELLKVYNQAAILDKNVLAANTLKFVNDRLRYVVNELDSVEGSLQRYKASNKITDISSQGQIYLQTVAVNDQKISDINVQLAMLDQVERYVNSKGDLGGVVPSTLGVSDPVLTDLLQKLSDLELEYTQTKKIVPENNPAVVALKDGIEKLKPGILENIKSQRRNLEAAKKDLVSTSNEYSSILKSIPAKERELLSISRQQSIKNSIYTFLLQKREETALSFASAIPDSRILDKAETSGGPVSPKKNLIYLGAILSSLLLGIVIISLKEMLTRTVQQRSDIEKYTDIPFLGEVAYDTSKSSIVIGDGKRSFIAEQFRQLRTTLSYLGVDEGHKRILITSSISGEGKSFIASNLAISLALTGKKVIMLELDLRKPKLSDQFNVTRRSGLSNYLIGKTNDDEIIQNTNFENLQIIPSGPLPPNPSELISNGKLEILLAQLENSFDYIIIDTAPVNPVTDAFILSPISDVTLYIIRYDYTPKIFVQKLQESYSKGTIKKPAIVYNGIRGKGINKYGYGYGYGYGYTEDETEKGFWNRLFKSKSN